MIPYLFFYTFWWFIHNLICDLLYHELEPNFQSDKEILDIK